MMMDRLTSRIAEMASPVVVGLDPTPALVPEWVIKEALEECGATPEGLAESYWRYNKAIVDAVCDIVPAVKPQSAMYEQLGVPGVAVFEKTVKYCHEKGLLVIGDIKRGDIGSTSAAYAAGHLGGFAACGVKVTGFDEDFATVNPYLGTDGIKPFVEVCREHDRALFVLVKTSNPSSGEFQDRLIDGRMLYEWVADKCVEWGEALPGEHYDGVGAVVGATYPEVGRKLRERMPKTCFLVPGYGAQGASAKDLGVYFDADGTGAIVNSSRGIIGAWKQEKYAAYGAEHFADAARAAALDMIKDLRENALTKRAGGAV